MSTETIVTAPKLSFFQKLKLKFKELYSHAPAVEQAAATTLTYAAPIVEGILAVTEPALLPEVEPILNTVQSDLAAAALIIKETGATPTALSFLGAVRDNLGAIETAAKVKSPASADKISAITQLVIVNVVHIIEEFTPAPAPTPAPLPVAPVAPVVAAEQVPVS